jgi:ABC-type multidrug transport system fused ATPase/permease subunit
MKDMKFAYPSKMEVQILDGVSIEVAPNQIVAIVGASGKLNFSVVTPFRLRKIVCYFSN